VHGAQRRLASRPSTTTEMLRSEEPCAIARMLTARAAERAEELGRDARRAPPCRRRPPPGCSTRGDLDALDLARRAARREGALAPPPSRRAARPPGTAKQIECSELPCEIMITEMPCVAQRAEQPVRRARHADHARALDVDQRHLLDAGEPLDREATRRPRVDQRARVLGVEGVADPDRDLARSTAGAMVCGWMTLAPKYASSIASLYESESMTFASGTQPRVGGEHAVHVGPDVDLRGLEQRAEDRGREVAAVAAQRGLQPVGDDQHAAMKPVTAGPSGPHSSHQRVAAARRLTPFGGSHQPEERVGDAAAG
jgi:hypothetical protein